MRVCPTRLSRGCGAMLVLVALSGCGVFCPGDVPMSNVSATVGGFPNLGACNTARTAATPCAPLITTADAACTAHCASGWMGAACTGKAKNPDYILGNVCFAVDTSPVSYSYSCVKTATCTC
ncbi:MAG: hypothetical protein JWQ76_2335 [Ramlibacter sp.]|nr:hypothetical protein [Ramlibacter sp.]